MKTYEIPEIEVSNVAYEAVAYENETSELV